MKRAASTGPRRLVTALVLMAAPIAGVGAAAVTSQPALAAQASCTGQIGGVSVYAGSNQVAEVGTSFGTALEVAVVDTGGCAVPDVPVELVAPGTGPSGYFPGGALTVTVSTGSNGLATAPSFTANEIAGSFEVEAQIETPQGSESTAFELTNTTIGVASSVVATSGNAQSAHVGDSFASPLGAEVTGAAGNPIAGTTVDFDIVPASGAGATFVGGGSTAEAETNEQGIALSPLLTAGDTVGTFTVTAEASGTSVMATFSLTDLAGPPSSITPGLGSSQSAELGSDFTVPLAVTVTDADSNPVSGAEVTFKAPASGPSGVFGGSGVSATVLTDSDGIAIAPDFSANEATGGYVVTASVAGLSTPAAFALVNEARTSATAPGPAGTYWLATSTGRVFASGAAGRYGSVPPSRLSSPVVGIAPASGNRGYWLVTAKGTVYAFGDAANLGSPSHLVKPIVGIASTPDGKGYWLVASDGGVFSYGDAKFYGSTGSTHLVKPIVGIAAAPGGHGYWLVASDGGIFAFGQATYLGSGVALSPKPVTALVAAAAGYGYWVVSSDGTAAGFGDAGGQGNPAVKGTEGVVVAGAA